MLAEVNDRYHVAHVLEFDEQQLTIPSRSLRDELRHGRPIVAG